MFKMGLHDPIGYLKNKLWPKEGSRIKLLIWLSTVKSQETPWFPCMQVMCHVLFVWNFTSIKGLHTKLWAPKVTRVPISGILGLPLGSHGTKWHLGVDPVARHIEYYKGEGGGFPKSGMWWVLWIYVYPWFVCAPKVF
jgi:hypothetical protein